MLVDGFIGRGGTTLLQSFRTGHKIAIVLIHWHFRSRSLCCVILHKMTLFFAKLFRRLLRTRAPLTGSPQSAPGDHQMILSRGLLSSGDAHATPATGTIRSSNQPGSSALYPPQSLLTVHTTAPDWKCEQRWPYVVGTRGAGNIICRTFTIYTGLPALVWRSCAPHEHEDLQARMKKRACILWHYVLRRDVTLMIMLKADGCSWSIFFVRIIRHMTLRLIF